MIKSLTIARKVKVSFTQNYAAQWESKANKECAFAFDCPIMSEYSIKRCSRQNSKVEFIKQDLFFTCRTIFMEEFQ